jgi:hypothetical protein
MFTCKYVATTDENTWHGTICDSLQPFQWNFPYHTGHPAWQWPNPHGPPNAGWRGDCTCAIRLGWDCIVPIPHGPPNAGWRVIVPIPHGSAEACTVPVPHRLADTILQLYHTGRPRLHCTHTTWLGWGYIVPVPHGQPVYGSPYHIYHLPILVIHLYMFDM